MIDIRHLLGTAAAAPVAPPDLAVIRSRARRLGWRRVVIWAASITGGVVGVMGPGQLLVNPASGGGQDVSTETDGRVTSPEPGARGLSPAVVGERAQDVDPGARPGPGLPTATRPVRAGEPGADKDECATWEVVFAGRGRECTFRASSPGGYEASGGWSITVHRGDKVITFASDNDVQRFAASCGATGTIQPGDFVEVRVGLYGSAAAGKSYGKNCSS